MHERSKIEQWTDKWMEVVVTGIFAALFLLVCILMVIIIIAALTGGLSESDCVIVNNVEYCR